MSRQIFLTLNILDSISMGFEEMVFNVTLSQLPRQVSRRDDRCSHICQEDGREPEAAEARAWNQRNRRDAGDDRRRQDQTPALP